MEGPLIVAASDRRAVDAVLAGTRTIALVGASANPTRPSHEVMSYLMDAGYEVLPVNPLLVPGSVLGQTVYSSLADLDRPVDLIDVFRRSEMLGELIDEAIHHRDRLQIRSIWLQLGVRDDAAVARAVDAGLTVVFDCCIKIEHRRWARSAHRRL